MKKFLFFHILCLFQLQGIAQQEFHLGGQFDMGLVTPPSSQNNLLNNKLISPHLGGLASLSYRFKDFIGIEVGIGQHWNNTRLNDPSFEQENEGFKVKLSNKNYYWNYYASLTGFYRLGFSKTYLYGKLGYSFNTYGGEALDQSKPFEITQLATNKTVSVNTNYVQSNHSIVPEIGIQKKTGNRHLLSAGIKMNIGTEKIMDGTYTIQDNVTGATTTDQISSFGNLFAINVRYDFLLHYIGPRGKTIKEPAIVDVLAKEPEPKKVEERKIDIEHRIKVGSPKVKVLLWDHKLVDGDRVSLNLNGEWILEDYTLKKEKYELEIELKEGRNLLGLHALNLGKHGLNTAAIIVNDGIKEKQLILRSSMKKTGTLEINYEKPE